MTLSLDTHTHTKASTQHRVTETQTHTLMFTVSDCSVNKEEAPASDLKGAKSNRRDCIIALVEKRDLYQIETNFK